MILASIAATIAMLACFYLVTDQNAVFGKTQGVILLGGEAASFMCLAYLVEARKKGREWVTRSLVWLSLVPLLLVFAYVQLPSSRLARYEDRVREAAITAASYRERHSGQGCAPLEAELAACQQEFEASRVRAAGIPSYRSAFPARFTFAGAIGALLMAGLSFRRTGPAA